MLLRRGGLGKRALWAVVRLRALGSPDAASGAVDCYAPGRGWNVLSLRESLIFHRFLAPERSLGPVADGQGDDGYDGAARED